MERGLRQKPASTTNEIITMVRDDISAFRRRLIITANDWRCQNLHRTCSRKSRDEQPNRIDITAKTLFRSCHFADETTWEHFPDDFRIALISPEWQ